MNLSPAIPPECFAAKAASFASLHEGMPTRAFIGNIEAEVHQVEAGRLHLPVTVNHTGHQNAWVCSPLTTYSHYALEETRRLAPRLIAPPLGGIIGLAGLWMRHVGLDRAISVNNWLLSTNLYPRAETIDLATLVASCRARWPDHAIWFRSLNVEQHADWMQALVTAGFELIPTRQVYLFRHLRSRARQHQNLRRDLHLLHTTPLVAVGHDAFTDRDFARSEALYAQLYLHKYSRFNPSYTAAFLKAWHHSGLLEFAGFRDDTGELRAVVGMFGQGSLLTAPIVGYDTAWPQAAGLYRLLMAHVLDMTIERDAELNLSAGAAHFKRLRGGAPAIEYSAVLSRHLPRSTRRALGLLRMLTTKIGAPMMKRFEL
jgi:Acetyltransferase (GNAT) domain